MYFNKLYIKKTKIKRRKGGTMKLTEKTLRKASIYAIKEVTTPEEKDSFQKIWRGVWLSEGYTGEEKYAKYEKYSVDLLLILFDNTPIGTVRLIKNNEELGLPTLNDFEIEESGEKKLMEITLLTILSEYRKTLAFLTFLKGIYMRLKKEGIEEIVCAIDERLFLLLTKKLSFHQIKKEKMYEGSITIPAYLNLSEAEEFVKKSDFSLYKFFTTKSRN